MDTKYLDVTIIGGGPAGLSAGLLLGRARKKVKIIDDSTPRNSVTREVHGYLTRNGISPTEFRRLARDELSEYPLVSFVDDTAKSITGEDGQFIVETMQGETILSKKVIFAVGMKDEPLSIAGLDKVYGKSAFVCPYCDGWELRDQPLVIINKGEELMHFAPIMSGWSKHLTVCTNGPDELTDEQRDELRRNEVSLFESSIKQIDSHDGIVKQVVLEDGTAISCRGIFFRPELVIGSSLPQAIGCEMTEWGGIEVDDFGKTSVPGIYSAGDGTTRRHQAIAAAAMGAFVAAMINNELNTDSWKRN